MANDEENKQPLESLESESNITESNEGQSDSDKNGAESIQENVPQNENQDVPIDESENLTQKKAKKLNKVLIIVVGVLFGVLLIVLILFFSGVFDSQEAVTPPSTTEQQNPAQTADGTPTNQQPAEVTIPPYEFKTTDINVPRLNKKLQALIDAPAVQKNNEIETNIEVTQNNTSQPSEDAFYDEELEALLPKEEQNIVVAKQSEPAIIPTENEEVNDKKVETTITDVKKEEIQENKPIEKEIASSTKDDKSTINSKNIEVEKESSSQALKEEIKQTNTIITEKNGKHFLKFIQVATLKYQLYTQFLREIKAVDARISICQSDGGRIQIFIGPFLDDKQRSFVIEQINKSVVNDAFGLEFTQEEYFRRCGIKDPS